MEMDKIELIRHKNGSACRYCTNFYEAPTSYIEKETIFANNPLAKNGYRCKIDNSNLLDCVEFACHYCTLKCSYIDKEKVKELRCDLFECRQCKKAFPRAERGGIVAVLRYDMKKIPEGCPIKYGTGITLNEYLCLECQKNPREDKTGEIQVETLPARKKIRNLADVNEEYKNDQKKDKPDYIT